MDNRQWKKIKNSIHFIALSKTCAQNANIATQKIFKSKWPLLKHTISAVHYLLRTLFKNLKLGSQCMFFKGEQVGGNQTPNVKSKRSKWKKIENSLHFITSSKNCVKESKFIKPDEDEGPEPNKNCRDSKLGGGTFSHVNKISVCFAATTVHQPSTTKAAFRGGVPPPKKSPQKRINLEIKKLAQSKWTLLKNTVSIIHFFLRTMFLHLELESFKVKIGFVLLI